MKTKLLGNFDIYINDGNYGEIYPDKESFQIEGIPFISASDFNGRIFNFTDIKFISEEIHFNLLRKGHLKTGDIVIVVRGNGIGNVGYFKDSIGECNINAQLAFIRTNPEELNSLYLYYLLSSQQYLNILKRFGTGSAQPQLPINRLKQVPIKYPKIEYQVLISNTLSTLDDKIELNNRINAELEAMAKTLYDYWFVQFDFPDAQGRPYKSSGGKMIWCAELGREVPEGWRVESLDENVNLISRGISPQYIEQGGICVLNQKCIRDNSVLFEFSRRHDKSIKTANTKKVKRFDILVNSTGVGTLGRVAIVKRLPEDDITVDSHVTIVRVNSSKINQLYFAFSLLQKQSEIERFSVGSTGQVELSKSQLSGIKLVIPPEALQASFGNVYLQTLERMSICETENQILSTLRDWLLPMLMNGQVRVS